MGDNRYRFLTLAFLGWLCFAIGVARWLHNASASVVAAIVWTLAALVLLACWKIVPTKAWALNIDLRWLVLFHLTRLAAGVYFLVLCQHGQLPCAFATRAGWGDIIVAIFSLPVVAAMRARFAKRLLLVWNTVGFIDIIFVVLSALCFGLRDWQSMHALRELPLSLLPTFLVPLIIASHVLIFVRLAHARNAN